ncbi:MAG: mannitol dehydrogenase family protein [Acetobacteraceae bacterium]|nr:mannitol dehydrogenase family protein [Acetobacteraceae bacterium]
MSPATLPRLSDALLPSLPAGVRRPAYDRRAVSLGIVHIGLGVFHRAHQAVYTDDCLANGELDWGIAGLSLRSSEVRAALEPQDGLYTVLERSPDGNRPRIIGAIQEAIAVPESSALALRRLSDPATRIISLTVTEKAYCQGASSGTLDETHPGIMADLAGDGPPSTIPGLLVEAFARRRAAGAPPCTVLVCDNLPSNGATVARIITRFAECRDPGLARYITDAVPFPSTMVDRIVPATTDADRAAVELCGYRDAWPVVTEPFSQWVIEDHFAAGRPRWENAGATLVHDVAPFETMKLRILNGAHSALAYLGASAGIETVADAITDPALAAFLRRLWDADLVPTVPSVPGVSLARYTGLLEERFRNRSIRHRLQQIAMDGSQKLPQRLLAPAIERLSASASPRFIALALAGWARYLLGRDEQGATYAISDPLADRLTHAIRGCGHDALAMTERLFAVREVFDPELVAHAAFRDVVREAIAALMSNGVRSTLADWVRSDN